MVPMKALVGFSDKALITPQRPAGGIGAGATFDAPTADIARALEAAGLAERSKAPAEIKA